MKKRTVERDFMNERAEAVAAEIEQLTCDFHNATEKINELFRAINAKEGEQMRIRRRLHVLGAEGFEDE